MKKVTGEQSQSLPSSRPSLGDRASQSAPTLMALTLGDEKRPEDDAEEDEDVPLAILQAHGFPNKNRPPTQLTSRGSYPNLRPASQLGSNSPAPQSVAGSTAGSKLPVFARNLPPDPYFGASLVQPSNRESFAVGGASGPQVTQSSAQPSLP